MVETLPADNQIISTPHNATEDSGSCPFEGPEKLLEIWFAPTPGDNGPPDSVDRRVGLRTVDRGVWEDMLNTVKCKVLSVVVGREMDAHLLSESSFFVFPHKLILKTCGTTLNLLGLPRILAIARTHCGYDKIWRCFYSRKSFMFPERQVGPHREWRNEVEYLDALFDNGAAYTVGKMNGDHWLLYMTSPPEADELVPTLDEDESNPPHHMTSSAASSITLPAAFDGQDYTLEVLMTKLGAAGRRPFLFLDDDLKDDLVTAAVDSADSDAVSKRKGALVSHQLGIDSIFPTGRTRLDSYAFDPCGYSANALVDSVSGDEGYYTIHVTPEEGWSYASFECNVPVHSSRGDSDNDSHNKKEHDHMPDLETLIQRVVNIFQPGHLTLTLFVSNDTNSHNSIASAHLVNLKEKHEQPTSVEVAQCAFRQALIPRGYRRTDKINYEFGDYDLAFATFQKK